LIAFVVGLAATGPALAQHAGDLWVARTSADQLTLSGFAYAEQRVVLPETSGLLAGWADNAPGFDRLITEVPAEELFRLDSGADIWLEIVALDPALRVIDNSFQILDSPGQQTRLGNHLLHTHLTWHIDLNDPDFDPQQTCWEADLLLFDAGSTNYGDSPVFTMTFCNVDCLTGDVNADGTVDFFDIDPFVTWLVAPDEAEGEACAADINGDGAVDFFDIDPFVQLLVGDG
jgi:hypothetical protein